MPGSSERIDYRLRPAKQIERKMLCEALWHLAPFADLKTYRYVGFGSYYFADFSMFHKQLGVSDMTSIEGDRRIKKQRFLDNRPFNCIHVEFGMSNRILPKLEWDDIRTVLWLDYDFALDDSVLQDVEFFCKHACPGSVIMVTLDADPSHGYEDERGERLTPLQKLRRELGRDKIPAGVDEEDLDGWGKASVFRQILAEEVENAIAQKNIDRHPAAQFKHQQLFNFQYKDSAMMFTAGWIIYDAGSAPTLASCGFDNLDYYRPGVAPFRIRVPKLTFREIRNLNEKLPLQREEELEFPSIPRRDVNMYKQFYRWFPAFAEMEL